MPEIGAVGGKRNDPMRKFQFRVYTMPSATPGGPNLIPEASALGFMSVSGLNSTTEMVEYKEGDKTYTRKIPGKTKFDNITLSRGVDKDNRLYQWRRLVEEQGGADDEVLRSTLVIEVYDRRGVAGRQLVKRWLISEAWPVSHDKDELNGDSSDVWIEKVEFACENQVLENGLA